MEFSLLLGQPEKTEAMKAGIARHAVLEEENLAFISFALHNKYGHGAARDFL
ncbi:hypothetical protein CsSME_00016621 [Camellia sinensis var. sinensis]